MPRQTNRGRTFPAQPLTSDEVERLIRAVSGRGATAVRNRALIALLWRSGLRISETLALRPSDIDERQGTVLVRRGKGGKARVAVIDAKALGYLRAWTEVRKQLGVNGRQPLFCTISGGSARKGVLEPGGPLSTSYVRRLLPRLAQRAGIEKRAHPHGLRHTMATEAVARRVPLHVIAAQLGHASTATTDTYLARIAPVERIAAMRAAGWTMGSGIGSSEV